ncbi:Trypsin [Nannocystis exedens]|uniref:Trypsin n=1 Tax=Nannocystis exedens TaxID=54 RepID=A0A1I2FAW8_9BACT|nr:trypsin-like serine protease [Nannocystis exedens]PCC73001.1 Hemolysin, chromosomal [Nannocystis exedens]SFF01671.1 Trypsin [Nannocystis exedens]
MKSTEAEAAACDYAQTVFILNDHDQAAEDYFGYARGRCTGAYVGNGVVVTAGHCINGGDYTVSFGEDGNQPVWSGLADCVRHPSGEWLNTTTFSGADIGFCIVDVDAMSVAHPVPPKIPVMVPNGCEADYLRDLLFGTGPGLAWATYVGMGFDSVDCADSTECPARIKRYADGEIVKQVFDKDYMAPRIVALQPYRQLPIVVKGDSGGPLNFPMLNNSRRIVGTISSRTPMNLTLPGETQEQNYSVVMLTPTPLYLRWIEVMSGLDISPCHSWSTTYHKWVFDGGAGCGAGYEASPIGGPQPAWSSQSGAITACAATDMLTSSTACAGWTGGWSTPPPWVAAHLGRSAGDGILDLALAGTSTAEGMLELPGLNEVYGSEFADSLAGTADDDEIFMGAGDDNLGDAGAGDDEVHGGSGDDRIRGGDDDDVLYAGRGTDAVYGDGGDDVVVILGRCELELGEVYDGGAGSDTLITPFTPAQLATLGVTVSNFETILTTHPDAETPVCSPSANTFLASAD